MTDKNPIKKAGLGVLVVAALITLLPLQQAMATSSLVLAATASLEKIRVADHERYQRVVIDTSEAVTFKVIEGEAALVLTLNGIASEGRTWTYTDLGQVKGIKLTSLSDTSVQITFDLTGAVRPRISAYTPDSYGGHRIVIDLWPARANVAAKAPRVSETVPAVAELKPEAELAEAAEAEADEVPGLREIQAWPTLVDEVATTLTPREAMTPFPERPAPEHSVETILGKKPDAGGIMNAVVTTDPLAAARERMTRGAPEEACKVLQTNFPRGTWNIEAMVLEGACLRALGNLTEANTLYTEVLSFQPDSIDARLGLADIQAQNGDFAAARDNYIRALAGLPEGDLATDVGLRLAKVENKLRHGVD